MSEERPLPPGLDLLWGRRGEGSRGPRRGMSVDEIVAAAVRVADAEGLEAVSMARVAKEIGFTPMSLYRYVASKEELLQLMWNASAEDAEGLVLAGDDWRARLPMWAMVQRDVLDQHPWITQLPMSAPPVAPNSMTFVERGLEALDGTGLPGHTRLAIIGLLSSYALSEARMAHDAARAAREAAAAGDAPPWSFDALLRELADEATYPRVYQLARTPPPDPDPDPGPGPGPGQDEPGSAEPPDPERMQFLFGIETILDGVQALIDRAAH